MKIIFFPLLYFINIFFNIFFLVTVSAPEHASQGFDDGEAILLAEKKEMLRRIADKTTPRKSVKTQSLAALERGERYKICSIIKRPGYFDKDKDSILIISDTFKTYLPTYLHECSVPDVEESDGFSFCVVGMRAASGKTPNAKESPILEFYHNDEKI